MKKTIMAMLAAGLFLAACNSGTKKEDTTVTPEPVKTDTVANKDTLIVKEPVQLYACPMHPEVTGKKDDKCPKCGMKLTEPVKENKTP